MPFVVFLVSSSSHQFCRDCRVGRVDLVAARGAVTEAAATTLLGLGLVNLANSDGDGIKLW